MTDAAEDKLLLGLIGVGIQRSLTPAMQEEEARHHGLRLHYQRVDLAGVPHAGDELAGLLRAARLIGFAGLNITYPFKQVVLPLLDEVAPDAGAMGAVNTVVLRGGRLVGHNTDGWGWAWGFRRALPDADLRRVVLLGAGGAGSAVAESALRLGVEELRVVDTEPQRAQVLVRALQDRYPGRTRAVGSAQEALPGATGLIHASPTGMAAVPGLPLPAELLHPGIWVSEVVYVPLETPLLQAARARGCRTVDGGTMAVGQAIGAFELFTGRAADPVRMERHFRGLLADRTTGA